VPRRALTRRPTRHNRRRHAKGAGLNHPSLTRAARRRRLITCSLIPPSARWRHRTRHNLVVSVADNLASCDLCAVMAGTQACPPGPLRSSVADAVAPRLGPDLTKGAMVVEGMTSRPGWTPLLVGGVVVGPLDDVAAVGGAAAGHIRHLARAPGLELAVAAAAGDQLPPLVGGRGVRRHMVIAAYVSRHLVASGEESAAATAPPGRGVRSSRSKMKRAAAAR